MEKQNSVSDVPSTIHRQEKENDLNSDGNGVEEAGGIRDVEEDTISNDILKVIGSPKKVQDQYSNGSNEGAAGGVEELNKVNDPIKELSSGAGEKEQPTENIDKLRLLQVLPAEMWEKIAEYLDDGDDLRNLSKSSPFFEDLLKPKKVLYLFPSVWMVVGEKFFRNYEMPGAYNESDNGEDGNESVIPSILNLRLVSKIWSKAVDKFIRNFFLQEGHDQVALGNGDETCEILNYFTDNFTDDSEDADILTRFDRHFDRTHAVNEVGGPGDRSPFLSGKVKLGGDPAPVMAMLQLYGHHVLQCTFGEWHGNVSPETAYSLYRQAIELMPNLKLLEFNYDGGYNDGTVNQEDLSASFQPMPFLNDLQLLSFIDGDPEIFSSVLQINSHVSTLITGDFRDEEEDFDMYSFPLPFLKRLKIEGTQARGFAMFMNLNLTHLDLQFGYIDVELSVVFDAISTKCKDTLTHLKLDFSFQYRLKPGYEEEFVDLKLHLPNLKTFICGLQRGCSLDFLLPTQQTLEYLDVKFGSNIASRLVHSIGQIATVNREGRFRFLRCIYFKNGSFRTSNIWQLFPKLTELKYSGWRETSRRFGRPE